jgi:hypothetical protein
VRSRLGSRFAILFFSQRSFTICYLFSLRIFWWLQVQKRFEALKKRKDPSAFTEEGEKNKILRMVCQFPRPILPFRMEPFHIKTPRE